MKAQLLRLMAVPLRLVRQGHPPFHEAGKVIEHPHAYKLVRQGCAVPADRECEEKAKMTKDRMDAAAKAYERLNLGIHFEDFDAYARGLLIGYKPDGKRGDTWKPGPNWSEGCEAKYYSDNEGDDDE